MAYTGGSIVDYLKSTNQDSSWAARKKLAESYGIAGYSGTAGQNTQLLNKLRSGETANTSVDGTAAQQTVQPKTLSSIEASQPVYKESDELTQAKQTAAA